MTVLAVLLEIVVVVFVVARAARFGAEDILAEPFREAVARRLPQRGSRPHLLSRGVFCRWCWSVWAAILVAPTWWLISDTAHVWDRWYVDLPALVMALSEAAALVQAAEPED